MQAQATNGGDLAWVTWAAMLRITAQSSGHEVADWGMVVDRQKQLIIQQPKIKTSLIWKGRDNLIHEDFTVNLGKGIFLDMVFVEGGTFMMGSNDGNNDEKPMHSVTLDSFWIGKYPVTKAQWKVIIEDDPFDFILNNKDLLKGIEDNLPVKGVTWDNAQEFIEKFNRSFCLITRKRKKDMVDYRLLTEAEWEYAARGGNKSKGYKYAGSNDIDEVAWYRENYGLQTHPVGQKKANELGIFDMSGNVLEWCKDWYDSAYYKNSPSINPKGASSGSYHVFRGGSWFDYSESCRATYRCITTPENRNDGFGFRVCLPVS